jgi:GT2 family glycosyltransferase
MSHKFAAFIMTYERPNEVKLMIEKLMAQTLAPEKILVVDNSSSTLTADLVKGLGLDNVEYVRVGYNSGPAGAAHVGLKRLSEEGYKWIYWGDDDDPPEKDNDFEEVFGVIEKAKARYDKIGIVSKGAGKFNPYTARTSSYMNRELQKGIMETDLVPGNNVLLVNSDVIRQGVLPTKELFFGFEELDFCLQVRNASYKILFDADAFLKRRIEQVKGDPDYRWPGRKGGELDRIWRQYYSSRNMLKVLYKNGYWIALFFNIGKTFLKSFYGFRYGRKYGSRNFKIQLLALVHFFSGTSGRTNLDRLY